MAKLTIPSLQHLARSWQEHPALIQKKLVNLAEHPPTFGYNALFGAVNDMLVLKVPYNQIVNGIKRKVLRPDVQENFLEVLPLIRDYFEGITPDSVNAVKREFYGVGRGLLIPFEPPLVYGLNGEIFLPWLSFWRSNPLAGEKLSLFVTIVEEMLRRMPDLDGAKFHILDFSCPSPKKGRLLRVIDAAGIERLTEARKTEMLEIFAEGFFNAKAQLQSAAKAKAQAEQQEERDPRQTDLFGN